MDKLSKEKSIREKLVVAVPILLCICALLVGTIASSVETPQSLNSSSQIGIDSSIDGVAPSLELQDSQIRVANRDVAKYNTVTPTPVGYVTATPMPGGRWSGGG